MKIISWNINGYRAITGQNPSKRFDTISKENKLFAYIDSENPDLIAMQETKAEMSQITEELRCPNGYIPIYNHSRSKKGYSGVATFVKREPKEIKFGFNIEKFDTEGRVIECIFDDITHFNIYFPNAQQIELRLDYKLEFYSELYKYILNNYSKNDKIIISGDFNTAHKAIDLARPEQNVNTSGFLQVERDKLDELFQMGFIDSFRAKHSEPNQYSWWSNRSRARENNVGWRIDYHFLSPSLENNLIDCNMQQNVMGSDHCPIVLNINL